MAAATTAYAKCLTCNVSLPTPADAQAHRSETFEAAKRERGPLAPGIKSHTTTVLNPTPEEIEENRIRGTVISAMDRATERFCEDIEMAVSRGNVTADEVAAALRGYPDFEDAWDDYRQEMDS